MLRGESDRVDLLGVDRWIGGTHVTPDNAWRWDEAAHVLVPPPAQLNGFVTMSATTRSSTATSTRATSRIRWIAACVSGAVGALSVISASIFFASGESTATPVMNVIA